MKTLILISAFALSALMVSAAFPKPATIFAPRSEKYSRKELDLLANSAVLQRAAVRYLFKLGDANRSGNLDLAELKNVYSIIGQMDDPSIRYDDQFVQNEFNQGNFVIKNQVISIDEFAFLFNRLFKFMNSNPVVCSYLDDSNLQYDQIIDISIKLDQNLGYFLQDNDFPGLYQEFNTDGNSGIDFDEFRSGLQSFGDRIGINFIPDDYTIRDYYELMLSSTDTLVSETKFRNAMVPFLQNYLWHIRIALPIVEVEVPEEEEEMVMEEEHWDDDE